MGQKGSDDKVIDVEEFIELNCNGTFKLEIWELDLEKTIFSGWSNELQEELILIANVESWEIFQDKITLNVSIKE